MMSRELTALVATVIALTMLGLVTIVAIVIFRPSADNGEIVKSIVSLLVPTLLTFIAAFKGVQNSADLKDLKQSTNGAIEHQVSQASAIATLTEQVKSAKTAADVAADNAAATANRIKAVTVIK
jgi:hypothetical protein